MDASDLFANLFGGGGGLFGDLFGGGTFSKLVPFLLLKNYLSQWYLSINFYVILGFGGSYGGGARRRRLRKGSPIHYPLPAPLDQLYNGKTRKLRIRRSVACKTCQGKGLKPGKDEVTCQGCQGRGMQVKVVQHGNMVMQQQSACGQCQGEGKSIKEEDKCADCKGKKTTDEKHILEVNILPGMEIGQKIVLEVI